MKKLSLLIMGIGFLVTLSSTLFTIIHRKYDVLPIVLFWCLLTAFEFISVWIWLFSKTAIIQHNQKLVIISLTALIFMWILIVLMNPDSQSIFVWALKTLNNSGLFFLALIIYYRTKKTSGDR